MNLLDITCISIAVLAVLVAVAAIVNYRRKTSESLEKVAHMLDMAIDGSFVESIYDESLLSSVEARLARYLSICTVSSKNLLYEKNKIKELISDISHQTKTPISNILLYSQLLSEKNLPEDCRVCVKALSSQAEKLNFLINSLVKTSRLETGIITVSPKKEAVDRLFNEVREQIMPKADAKGISIIIEETDISAFYDLKWTVEAVYNIVDNAVKYTKRGESIKVKATPYELFCRIDIKDTGIGIEESEQNNIFARFYRSAAVNGEEGVGLGLFLAREIISTEGGYIKVASELGKGSTFSVFLPMEK